MAAIATYLAIVVVAILLANLYLWLIIRSVEWLGQKEAKADARERIRRDILS